MARSIRTRIGEDRRATGGMAHMCGRNTRARQLQLRKLRLNVHPDGQGYDLRLQDTISKNWQLSRMKAVSFGWPHRAEGKVQHVAATSAKPNQRAYKLLRDSAIENVQHWTFVKPPTASYTEVIVYDYEDDPSLPHSVVITKVLFDLPDHVRILTNVPIIDTNKSKFLP
jgi:hypothetical protein